MTPERAIGIFGALTLTGGLYVTDAVAGSTIAMMFLAFLICLLYLAWMAEGDAMLAVGWLRCFVV